MNLSRSSENIHIKNSKHFNPASKFRLIPLLKKSVHQSRTHRLKTCDHEDIDHSHSKGNDQLGAFHTKQNNQITSRYILINEPVQVGATQTTNHHESTYIKNKKNQREQNQNPYLKMSKLGQKYVELNEKYLCLLENKVSSRIQSLYLSRSQDKFLRDSQCRQALSHINSRTAQKTLSSCSRSSRYELNQLKQKLNHVNFSKLRDFTSNEMAKTPQFDQQKFIKIKKKGAKEKENKINDKNNQNTIDDAKLNKSKGQKQFEQICMKSYKRTIR